MLRDKLESKILEFDVIDKKRREVKVQLDALKKERSALKSADPKDYLKSDRNKEINKERDLIFKQYKSLDIDCKLLKDAISQLKTMIREEAPQQETKLSESLDTRQKKIDKIYGEGVLKVLECAGAHDPIILKHSCGEEIIMSRATSMNSGRTKCTCENMNKGRPALTRKRMDKRVQEETNGEYEVVEYKNISNFYVKHVGCDEKPFKTTQKEFFKLGLRCSCTGKTLFSELDKMVKEETHGTYELVKIGVGSEMWVRHISCNGEPFKTNKTRFFKYGQRCKYCAKKGVCGRKSKLESAAITKDDSLL